MLAGRLARLVTAPRVSAGAAVVVACAAVSIPAILDFQQQETLARSSTIAYYRSVFDSRRGRILDEITTKGEIFIWKKHTDMHSIRDVQPEQQSELHINEELLAYLLEEYDEPDLRSLAVFLLKTSDIVYECAHLHEMFEDISSSGENGENFERGALKLDRSDHSANTPQNYFDILRDFLWGFWGTRPSQPLCHRESIIKVFGRRFYEAFWFLRPFLYCDEFIKKRYFGDKFADSSALYRLESIAMVVEQTDLENHFPDRNHAVMRTFAQKEAYEKSNPGSTGYNVRLELCD